MLLVLLVLNPPTLPFETKASKDFAYKTASVTDESHNGFQQLLTTISSLQSIIHKLRFFIPIIIYRVFEIGAVTAVSQASGEHILKYHYIV